nr:hypothetical protein BaRGS_031351 [Batillaria attramentaria]
MIADADSQDIIDSVSEEHIKLMTLDLGREIEAFHSYWLAIVPRDDNRTQESTVLQRFENLAFIVEEKEVDFALSGFSVTADRATVTDYSEGFFYDDIVLLVTRPTAEVSWTFFLQPFHWLVYVVIGASLLLVTALHVCLERHGVREIENGKLTAFSVVTKGNVPFNSLSEVVRQDEYRWGLVGGTLYESILSYRKRQRARSSHPWERKWFQEPKRAAFASEEFSAMGKQLHDVLSFDGGAKNVLILGGFHFVLRILRREVDFALSGFSVTADRATVTDYSEGFFSNDIVLLVTRPTAEVSWTFFLQPFHWLVYVVIGASLLLVTALHVCVERHWVRENDAEDTQSSASRSLDGADTTEGQSVCCALQTYFGTLLGRVSKAPESSVFSPTGNGSGSRNLNEAEDLTRVTELSKYGLQHILIYGCEVLSGEWVRQVVKTGEDSWRPLNIVLLCSLPCMQTALLQMYCKCLFFNFGVCNEILHAFTQHNENFQANVLEREYGTQTAFGMSSRWLLIPTGGDSLLDQLDVSNVTMDNVALIRPRKQTFLTFITTGIAGIAEWYTIVKPADDEWGSGTAADPDTGVFGHIIRKGTGEGMHTVDITHAQDSHNEVL